MKDRILLVNYDFPPTLAGVRRIVKFARYLPDLGFEPIVLCATPPTGALLDFDALAEVEQSGCQVWRTPSPDMYHAGVMKAAIAKPLHRLRGVFDLAARQEAVSTRVEPKEGKGRVITAAAGVARRMLALPDDRFPWLWTAIPAADHLMHSQAIKYVLTSSYPNSAHLVGLHLKRHFNIHWHADFRDGWMQNPYFADYITPIHRRMNRNLERKVVQSADTLTAVSDPIVDYLDELSGNENVYLLPNGFDPSDLDDVPVLEFDKFTLAYTGTMFMQRSPDSFFAAVRGLLDSYPGLAENFQVIFRSNMKREHAMMISELGLSDVIQNWGMGTWKEALCLQKSADALLVLEGENPNSHIMLTQKVFEYLATGKPILAVTPPGALANLVRQSGAGVVVAPDNVFRIKETLFEMFLGRMSFQRNDNLIQSFTRQRQTAELARIMRNGFGLG